MTEHEIALTRSVLAHAYWNKLTPEEATALNNLYYACELLRERARTAREEGRVEGAALERAAVVAWLRDEAHAPHPIEAGERALSPSGRGLLLLAASRIERGEHRREEE